MLRRTKKREARKRATVIGGGLAVVSAAAAKLAHSRSKDKHRKGKSRPIDVTQAQIVASIEQSRRRLKKMISPR